VPDSLRGQEYEELTVQGVEIPDSACDTILDQNVLVVDPQLPAWLMAAEVEHAELAHPNERSYSIPEISEIQIGL
jgi:hypothetical protein